MKPVLVSVSGKKNKIKNGLPRELVRDNALITWV
jgi:hypothetical protein